MNKKLLIDTTTIRLQMTESSDKKLKVRGEFARAGVPTANGRIYPVSIWQKEISRLKGDLGSRKIYAELDHPADQRTKLARVCGVITGLEINDDGVVIGEAEIIQGTQNGATLKAIMESNCAVGVSSRAVGSVKQESGYDVVQEDFTLMTFDFVADPANVTSYPEITVESKEKTVATESKEAQMMNSEPITTTKLAEEKIVIVADKEVVEAKVRLEIELQESKKVQQELQEKNVALEGSVKELSEENEKVVAGFKGLGFSLYLERNLSGHPRAKEVMESLDFSQIESLSALKNVVSMHIVDAKNFVEQKKIEGAMNESKMLSKISDLEEAVSKAQAHLEEAKALYTKKIVQAQEKTQSLTEQLDASLGKSFLLKKAMFHPESATLLESFDALPIKNRDTAKSLFENFTPKSFDGKGKFDQVRARLAKKQAAPADLVEHSLESTKAKTEEKEQAVPGNTDLSEYKRLAGISA